jgi:hypothetical protein
MEAKLRKIIKVNYKNKLAYFVYRRTKARKGGETMYFHDTIRRIMRIFLSLGATDSSGMRVSMDVDAIVRILIMENSISSRF